MEFHEKLQYLRKQQNMTQEQLAEKLYVSRTAVSKWESGKGYPNIESLKGLSKVFAVSIDELLSSNELLELAETENRISLNKIYGLVYGILDLICIIFLFTPLFGQQEDGYVRAVTLLSGPALSTSLTVLYWIAFLSIALFGIVELAIQHFGNEKLLSICKTCSIVLHAMAIFLFTISRQPYVTAFLFLFLMIKIALLMKKSRAK